MPKGTSRSRIRTSRSPRIHILSDDSNQRGDLFTRGVADVLGALGWQDFKFDVAKAGREIDVSARHRAEGRLLRAECKAESRPIGGDAVNKFCGAVQVEQHRAQLPISSYYLSLSGFTSSAEEQEIDAERALVLIDDGFIIRELQESSIIISSDVAAEMAKAAPGIDRSARVLDEPILLIDQLGWLWLVIFCVGAEPRYFSLIHGSGDLLAPDIGDQISIRVAKTTRLTDGLTYVPNHTHAQSAPDNAISEYRAFLAREYGSITLEGIPADEAIGTASIPLAELYIPMYAHVENPHGKGEDGDPNSADPQEPSFDTRRIPIAELLAGNRHIAIVGPPGSGKSTIVKWLATTAVESSLAGSEEPHPLPIVVKCRSLGVQTDDTIDSIIDQVIQRAELGRLRDELISFIRAEIVAGNVLLVFDGLDEIANTQQRARFVSQLRTFMGRYPAIRIVVTSRPTAFNAVAGTLRSSYRVARVADLQPADILQLCVSWGGLSGIPAENSEEFARQVLINGRVRALAVNPLLLTTMLLVNRWLGQLPRKRTVLYQKAIEVLAMTWNVEAYEPLDMDELLPQLGYLAYQLMTEGRQRVTRPDLLAIIGAARSEMPAILAYARQSPGALLDAVESRSSILSGSDLVEVNGKVETQYEFKHLAFQEYLAALAIVHGWIPGGGATPQPLVPTLSEHFGDDTWEQVIPLAAVLSGPRASELVEYCLAVDPATGESREGLQAVCDVLADCLIDEVQVAPQIAEKASEYLIRYGEIAEWTNIPAAIYSSKFADIFHETAWRLADDLADSCIEALSLATRREQVDAGQLKIGWGLGEDGHAFILANLNSADRRLRIASMTALMDAGWVASGVSPAFVRRTESDEVPQGADEVWLDPERLKDGAGALIRRVISREIDSPLELTASYWALAWLGQTVAHSADCLSALLNYQVENWKESDPFHLKRMMFWAIASPKIAPELRGCVRLKPWQRSEIHQLVERQDFDSIFVPGSVALLYYAAEDPDDLAAIFSEEKLCYDASPTAVDWLHALATAVEGTRLHASVVRAIDITNKKMSGRPVK